MIIHDRTLQRMSGALCIASVIVYLLLMVKVIDFSMLIAFPMHAGVIYTGFALGQKARSPVVRWNGVVPKVRRLVLPLVLLIGLANIFLGFANLMPTSQSGAEVHHLSVNFENGKCLAVFNRDDAVEMPLNFCSDFNLHLGVVFCGAWMCFSALLNWMSWMRRSANQS